MEIKNFVVSELEKADKVTDQFGLHYAIIFWKSPFNTLERRIIYSPNYCEVTEWINRVKKGYISVEHVEYVDGVIY